MSYADVIWKWDARHRGKGISSYKRGETGLCTMSIPRGVKLGEDVVRGPFLWIQYFIRCVSEASMCPQARPTIRINLRVVRGGERTWKWRLTWAWTGWTWMTPSSEIPVVVACLVMLMVSTNSLLSASSPPRPRLALPW